ncbi:MAG: glycosyltransferase [Planctomycetota bacterium]|nr:glycosyltransferase [Planctomycetota bacterium]
MVDEPQAPLERVRFVCPPRWVATILSRALAKGLWMVITGLRFRPDLYMGYHFLPGACSALIAARLFGRPACYQMTAGPVEVFGGGFHAEHWVTRSLAQPSAFLERLAMAVARQFELVVVRGCKAKTFLAERRLGRKVAVITGCVSPRPETSGHRPLHLAFVGRIEEDKQPIQFVEITAVVRRTVPGVRAVMLGGGPLMDAVRRRADELGVADCIDILGKRDDVAAFLATSKVFVLTSQSEGLSIAMAEAMAAGAVPVVADVGELGDLVENGVNGYLVEPDNIDQYATHISSLLRDPVLWTRCSQAAAAAATRHCGVDAVTALWRRHLDETIQRAAGHPTA